MINQHADVLTARGISSETIRRYQLSYSTYTERPALLYPTIGAAGKNGTRVKFIDGQKPKYIWQTHDASNVYYSAGGLVKAIAENEGLAWLVNGEAATWAFHSFQVALGKDANLAAPCVSWFGEGSAPSTLGIDLESWGVLRTFLIVDCDEAGYKAALKTFELLGEVPCLALKLPFEYGSGKDFNDLWIACNFDAQATQRALDKAPILKLEDIQQRVGGQAQPINLDEWFRPTQRTTQNGDVDFKNMQAQWIEEIISALGSPDKMEGHTPRWHCPLPTHADKNPSFTVDRKVNPPRPRCSCGIHDDDKAWDRVAQAKGLPVWLDYRNAHLPKTQPTVQLAKPLPPPTQTKRSLRKGSDVLKSLDTVMAGDTSAIGNPVIFPLRSMHYLGGLCHYIPAGMLVGVVGGSGEGKTSLVETCVDFWNKGGIDVVFYSPEWTSELILQRRVQRYTGYAGDAQVAVDDFTALTLWYKERDLGIPENQRDGKLLSSEQTQAYEKAKKQLLTWQGEVLIACDDDPTQPLYLETFLQLTADTLADLRRNKRRADIVAVDYLQLADLLEARRNEALVTQVIDKIKRHAILHKYVGFDASQVTKAASKAQKSGNGMVTSDDAQFVRSDKFNLMLTINRKFQEVNGELQATDLAHLYVDKNSLGRAKQKLLFQTDYAHLRWLDKVIDENRA